MHRLSHRAARPPVGRESEIAFVFSFLKDSTNVVWLTADVHYFAAHQYHSDRAVFQDFFLFWEFVAGSLSADGFDPNAMDPTAGPCVDFFSVPDYVDQSPIDGMQHFGEVANNAENEDSAVRMITTRGNVLYIKTLSAP